MPGRSPADTAARSGAGPDAADCAAEISTLFAGVFAQLDGWRSEVVAALSASVSPAALDDLVAELVLPSLTKDALLIGAGFIAAPEAVQARDVHFAWWLGPLDSGPIFGSTTEPTRLDLSTRGWADYLSDVRSLEWYATPARTMATHVTGPYVDHLCTCDYILTLTMPVAVDGRMLGVVGADIAVRQLEREVLPYLLGIPDPLVLVNAAGRVVLSTAPSAQPGTLIDASVDRTPCPGTPLAVAALRKTSHTG